MVYVFHLKRENTVNKIRYLMMFIASTFNYYTRFTFPHGPYNMYES